MIDRFLLFVLVLAIRNEEHSGSLAETDYHRLDETCSEIDHANEIGDTRVVGASVYTAPGTKLGTVIQVGRVGSTIDYQ